ncbi:MAG: type IV pilus assembly protein PilM [Anaerosomatales bacterium]|nr:type IV pilus assembly protein PilM [Anaerosomatales bacterium]MDT8433203.1 type IV pilus assembly protein PilM [Anaerosomatales bacterium]
MGFISMGSGAPPVGLDIGTDHVRAAVLKSSSGSPTLASYGRVDVPMGAVVDGDIVDPSAVASAIRELWRQPGIKGRDVVTGISNQKVVVRLIDLPFMERDELQGAIQYQAQDYIPIPIEDAILDFHIIGDYMTPSDEHMMEVLLVAAQRDTVEATVAAVEGAGLRLASIDVTSFALVRSTLGSGLNVFSEDEEGPGEAVAVIHIGSGLTNIAVVEKGVPRFTRVSSLSGNQFTQAISNVLNLTFDDAERLKIRAGLPDINAHVLAAPEDPEAGMIQTAQDALEREVNKFIAEVRRSLDYYLTQTTQARTIRRIYLTGSSAQLANLDTYLEKGLQAEVVLSDPLRFIQVGSGARALVEEDRMGAAPAIGLALGGVI